MGTVEVIKNLLPAKKKDLPVDQRSTALSTSTVGEAIRQAQGKVRQAWRLAMQRSDEYARALDMDQGDIEDLDHLGGVIVVDLPGREILLVAKSTCGVPYGDTWRCLLQPRVSGGNITGVGGGTTFFALLTEKRHQEVLGAIAGGSIRIVNERIWP